MKFLQKVTIEHLICVDAYHVPTYSSPISQKAIVDSSVKSMKQLPSNETTSSAHILFPPGTSIGPDDRITTEDGTHPIRYISSTENYRNGKIHYIDVYIGRQKPGEDRK